MIRSMTGFGQAQVAVADWIIHADVKSVNHRYCEVSIRMPKEWLMYEEALRKLVVEQTRRGRVDVFITVERQSSGQKTIDIDWSLADRYMQLGQLGKERYGFGESLSLFQLLQLPELISIREADVEPDDRLEEALLGCVGEALIGLLTMRGTEGGFLARDLQERLANLATLRADLLRFAPQVTAEYAVKLKQRIQELIGSDTVVDEAKLATEIALFADRSNIDEELTRLSSHFEQFAALLQTSEPVGRKLDFLIQEMNREVNTIGSKANHAEIAAKVIDMKAELEKMREQIQNIE